MLQLAIFQLLFSSTITNVSHRRQQRYRTQTTYRPNKTKMRRNNNNNNNNNLHRFIIRRLFILWGVILFALSSLKTSVRKLQSITHTTTSTTTTTTITTAAATKRMGSEKKKNGATIGGEDTKCQEDTMHMMMMIMIMMMTGCIMYVYSTNTRRCYLIIIAGLSIYQSVYLSLNPFLLHGWILLACILACFLFFFPFFC
jgi:hypothetical protein